MALGPWNGEVGKTQSCARNPGVGFEVCIQCNQCALVCPHAAIRAKVYEEPTLAGRTFHVKSTAYKGAEYKGKMFTIQVAPEDCTGCNLCVNVCPAKDRTNPKHKAINMELQAPLRDAERSNYDFFSIYLNLTAPRSCGWTTKVRSFSSRF